MNRAAQLSLLVESGRALPTSFARQGCRNRLYSGSRRRQRRRCAGFPQVVRSTTCGTKQCCTGWFPVAQEASAATVVGRWRGQTDDPPTTGASSTDRCAPPSSARPVGSVRRHPALRGGSLDSVESKPATGSLRVTRRSRRPSPTWGDLAAISWRARLTPGRVDLVRGR